MIDHLCVCVCVTVDSDLHQFAHTVHSIIP